MSSEWHEFYNRYCFESMYLQMPGVDYFNKDSKKTKLFIAECHSESYVTIAIV